MRTYRPQPPREPAKSLATGNPPRDDRALRGPAVIRIGTSGWSYDHWRPDLYPPGLPARDRLARYAAAFPTAEFTSSFTADCARMCEDASAGQPR